MKTPFTTKFKSLPGKRSENCAFRVQYFPESNETRNVFVCSPYVAAAITSEEYDMFFSPMFGELVPETYAYDIRSGSRDDSRHTLDIRGIMFKAEHEETVLLPDSKVFDTQRGKVKVLYSVEFRKVSIVNPAYSGMFKSSCRFYSCGGNKPVLVYSDNDVVGMILPIRASAHQDIYSSVLPPEY